VYHRRVDYEEDGQRKNRIVAIDFGLKRLGVAVSDALGLTAQGLPTIERTRIGDDLDRIREVVEEYSPEQVIVGNPLGRANEPTSMSRQVSAFADKLRRRLKCPVELWDERGTSLEANRLLRTSGMGIEKRRQAVDRVAASILLQSYLDRRAYERKRESRGKGVGSGE